MRKLGWFAGTILILVILFNLLTFSVDETKQAILIQYGDIKRIASKPGLYFKIPFIQNVQFVEDRLLSYDIEPRKLITADKRRLVVNNYAIWRIDEPKRFKESMGARLNTAQTRIDDIVYSNLRNVLAEYEFSQIASGERAAMLHKITDNSSEKLSEYGIELIDVKVKRADLPEANEQAVYDRMKSERKRQASKLRAEGHQEAQEIRSEADKKSSIIVSEANKQAEKIRGEGEAQALEIYSRAYSQNPEFYEFWRTLESYKRSFLGEGGGTTILLNPDSEYMKLLKQGDLSGSSQQDDQSSE